MLFTTPAEARGLGGFAGNYAQLTIDHGSHRDDRRSAGSTTSSAAPQEIGARVTGPEEFLADYGRFGYDVDGEGLIGNAAFRNLTMTPNFPWVGEVGADIYRQVTGTTVDGVIAMDPFVIQALLAYVDGGIQLTTVPVTLTSKNAAAFLLKDQYAAATDSAVRVDALEEAAGKTFTALLAGALPDPARLGRDLGPLAAQRRLLMWTTEPAEQDLLRRVGCSASIPALDGRDGWSFTVDNAGANKIDAYLQRKASYSSSTDQATGETTGKLRVELTNTAPASGLPDYVIGNVKNLPTGTSLLYVRSTARYRW